MTYGVSASHMDKAISGTKKTGGQLPVKQTPAKTTKATPKKPTKK